MDEISREYAIGRILAMQGDEKTIVDVVNLLRNMPGIKKETHIFEDEYTHSLRIDIHDFHIAIREELFMQNLPIERIERIDMAVKAATNEFEKYIGPVIRNFYGTL